MLGWPPEPRRETRIVIIKNFKEKNTLLRAGTSHGTFTRLISKRKAVPKKIWFFYDQFNGILMILQIRTIAQFKSFYLIIEKIIIIYNGMY